MSSQNSFKNFIKHIFNIFGFHIILIFMLLMTLLYCSWSITKLNNLNIDKDLVNLLYSYNDKQDNRLKIKYTKSKLSNLLEINNLIDQNKIKEAITKLEILQSQIIHPKQKKIMKIRTAILSILNYPNTDEYNDLIDAKYHDFNKEMKRSLACLHYIYYINKQR